MKGGNATFPPMSLIVDFPGTKRLKTTFLHLHMNNGLTRKARDITLKLSAVQTYQCAF